MWKSVLAGTSALAIAGATLAYAQSGPPELNRAQRWRPSAEDVAAFGDARIAALHAGLKLSAEQEKNWPALESALRESRGAALTKLADAAAPLYQSLDEGQKHRFTVLARLGAHHRFGNMRGREWRANWRHHDRRGMMMMDRPMMDRPMMDRPQSDEQVR